MLAFVVSARLVLCHSDLASLSGGSMPRLIKRTAAEGGLLRIWHILGDSQSNPPVPALLPISKSSWWAGIKAGRYPAPIKLGSRAAAWRSSDIFELINSEGERS